VASHAADAFGEFAANRMAPPSLPSRRGATHDALGWMS
jgi:hypothetical protein